MTDPTARRTMAFINVGHSISHAMVLLFPTVVLALEQAWGMDYAALLPLGFAGYLLFGLGSLPAGWLADRWASGWLMVLFFLGTGGGAVLAGLAAGPLSLAAGLTLLGLFASIYHPVAIAWMVGAGDRPGRSLGINGVFGAAGTAGAALLAGVLTETLHWRAAFIIPGLASIAIGLWFWRDLAYGRIQMTRAAFRPGRAGAPPGHARRGLLLMLAAILFTGLIFQMNAIGLPKIFDQRLGADIGSGALVAGGLVSLVYAVSAVGQVIGGQLADRFDERSVYIGSYAVQILILAVAAMTENALLIGIVALAVTIQTGTQAVENCLVARYTPADWRATVFGLKFVLALGISAFGVPLIAFIFAATGGFAGVFWAMALFALATLGLGLSLPASLLPTRQGGAVPAAAE
jgi:MFS family permease